MKMLLEFGDSKILNDFTKNREVGNGPVIFQDIRIKTFFFDKQGDNSLPQTKWNC